MSRDDIENRIIELACKLKRHVQRAQIDPEHDEAAEAVIFEMLDEVEKLESMEDNRPRWFN